MGQRATYLAHPAGPAAKAAASRVVSVCEVALSMRPESAARPMRPERDEEQAWPRRPIRRVAVGPTRSVIWAAGTGPNRGAVAGAGNANALPAPHAMSVLQKRGSPRFPICKRIMRALLGSN